MPPAHDYTSVKSAYDKARKANPGLTPAAWRKAAAQDLGIPYNDFLKIWKTKGKVPSVPVSSPTLKAADNVVVQTMGLQPSTATAGSSKHITDILKSKGITTSHETKAQFTHTGKLYGGGTKQTKGYVLKQSPSKSGEFHISYFDPNGTVQDVAGSVIKIKQALQDAGYVVEQGLTKTQLKLTYGTSIKPPPGLSATSAKYLDEVDDLVNKGLVTYQEAISDLQQLVPKANFVTGELQKVQALISKYKKVIDDFDDAGKAAAKIEAGVVQTHLGPLTHDLAQDVYKKMKKSYPGASPATLRKAAAEYLQVDYKDYLKAWKKTTSAASKAKQMPLGKMPPVTDPPLVPSTAGKYSGSVDHDLGDLKSDLAKLLGPDGDPIFVTLDTGDFTGMYVWKLPQSIVKTQATRQAILDEIKKMGFLGDDFGGNTLKFWTKEALDAAKKKTAAVGKEVFTQTLVSAGKTVWETSSAAKWSNKFWKTLTSPQKRKLMDYSGSYYTQINGVLRGTWAQSSSVLADARTISSAMVRTEHAFTVFRGVDLGTHNFKVGSLWTDKGFVSTSINRNAGFSDHKPTKLVIDVPIGTKGFYIGPNSLHPSELEYLIDRNTKFRVVSVQGNTVHLVAIPK